MQVFSIKRDDPRWSVLTTERYRIDEHSLNQISKNAFLHGNKEIIETDSLHKNKQNASTASSHGNREIVKTDSSHENKEIAKTAFSNGNGDKEIIETDSLHENKQIDLTASLYGNREIAQIATLSCETDKFTESRIIEGVSGVGKQGNNNNTVAIYSIITRCREWIENVLFRKNSAAPLRITRHLLDRAREYVGKRSRNGRYIELYDDERDIIERLPTLLSTKSQFKIVEIGLNSAKNVCKIALLLPFSQWLPRIRADDVEKRNRQLFLLVGCDGGLKTFYAVQGVKWRFNYNVDQQITRLNLDNLSHFIFEENVVETKTSANTETRESEKKLTEEKTEEKEEDGWNFVKHRKRK